MNRAELLEVIGEVNRAFPAHDRTVSSPEAMEARHIAGCFGRAAMVGAGLISRGMAADDISLLITEAHGMQYSPVEWWYGHADLVVKTDEGEILVNTTRPMAPGNLTDTTWQPGVAATRQLQIVNKPEEALIKHRGTATPMPFATPGQIARLTAARPCYRAFEFTSGIQRYQERHPLIREGGVAAVSQYVELYERFVRHGR